ncbi:MAG: porin [Mariprofundus sp.]|nr:porin [Mariprofundus sp.]
MNIKKTLGMLAFACVLPVSANASGIVAGDESLIKLLEKKGVINKAEAKDLKKHDKSKFLKIGGRLQTQYKQVNNGSVTKNNTSEFFVRRARLTFKAQVTPWGFLKMQTEFGKGSVTLKDAYIGITPEFLPGFEMDVGNQYVQFSREGMNSSKYMHFVERNVTSQFAPFRQMGVNVKQKLMDKSLVVYAGLFNGSLNPGKVGAAGLGKNQIYHINLAGFKNQTQPNGFMYSTRVEYSPFGKFKKTQGDFGGDTQFQIAANYYAQKLGSVFAATAVNNGLLSNNAIGVDAAFRGYGLSVEAEWIKRTLEFDANNATIGARKVKQNAYSIQGGYMVAPKIEVVVRYERLDFDNGNVYTGTKGEDSLRATTIGANYYFKKHHMKIQANYVRNKYTMPVGKAAPKNDEFLVTTNYYF